MIKMGVMSNKEESKKKYMRAYRRVHMDFHNPDFLSDIGKNLDPKIYVGTLKKANINSLVVFAKCHHGNSYYPTRAGRRHPALGRDILGEILEECNRQGITPLVYYSVAWDKYVEEKNPDWLQRTKDGGTISHRIWKFLCLNSPYKREVVFPQLREIIKNYGNLNFLGFWLDVCWMVPEGCYCEYCKRKFLKEYGHSIEEAGNRERLGFLRESVINFLKEAKEVVKRGKSSLLVGRNQVWHSMLPLYETSSSSILYPGKYDELWKVPDFMVTERSSPCGYPIEPQGILDASLWAKYFRGFDKPFEILLTRFIHGWGAWDIMPPAYLRTVFAQIVANGGVISCGDQAYPNCTLDRGVYEMLGEAFSYIVKREKWFIDKEEVANVCILTDEWGPSFRGVAQTLSQLQIPFAIRDFIRAKGKGLDTYKLVVCPTLGSLNEEKKSILETYLNGGGKILADCSAETIDKELLERLFGVTYIGQSPYSIGYLDMSPLGLANTLFEIPLLVEGPFVELEPKSAEKVIDWLYPRTESMGKRYWRHPNAPPGVRSSYLGAAINKVGNGQSLLIAAPIFRDYWTKNHWYLKPVVKALLEKLYSKSLIRAKKDYINLEICLTRDEKSIQIHLITYEEAPKTERFSLVEENPAIYNLSLDLSKELVKNVAHVYLAPGEKKLDWRDKGDYIEIDLPKIQGYEILVVE